MLERWHPDRREVAGLVGLRELFGVATIGLHLVAGLLLGMSDGAMTSQSTPSLVNCQYKA